MQTKKVLVTGGEGFIGSHLVHELVKSGADVTVIDNHHTYGTFSKEYMSSLVSERVMALQRAGRYIRQCVTEADVDSDFDVIYHLAGYPRQWETARNPYDAATISAQGLANVLNKQWNLERFVYFSTSMVYGDFPDQVHETRQPNPQGLYGFMRLIGEQTVRKVCEQKEVSWNIIRPCTVYGSYDTHNRIIGKFMDRAMKNLPLEVRGPDVVLDFTHVTDLVSGCMALYDAILNDRAHNEVFNLSHSKKKYTIAYLAELMRDITDSNSEIILHDPDATFPERSTMSIDKARRLLGYDSKVDLETGLAMTYDWFRNSPTMQNMIP